MDANTPHTPLDFTNTEVAFALKSTSELKQAALLFKALSYPRLVGAGKVASDLSSRLHLPVGWALKPTIYRHFVAGETLVKSLPAVRRIYAQGAQCVMDYSAEGGDTDAATRDNYEANLRAVRFVGTHPELSHAVFKVSGIAKVPALVKFSEQTDSLTPAEQKEIMLLRERFMTLCRTAHDLSVPILVDAEHYAYQDLIDQLTEEAMELFNQEKPIVFATLQMYRRDRLPYLRHLLTLAQEKNLKIGVKFVRGAYMEEERERAEKMGYPDPICPTKEATDVNYDQGVAFALSHLEVFELFCGTHNEESCLKIAQMMQNLGLEPNDRRIYMAQLYGMSDNLTYNLAHAGYRVSKYVPYAPVNKVLPYLVRRAQENTSLEGQTGRELQLIRTELRRRKEAEKE